MFNKWVRGCGLRSKKDIGRRWDQKDNDVCWSLVVLAEVWQHLTVFQKLTLIGVITKDYWEARVKAGR